MCLLYLSFIHKKVPMTEGTRAEIITIRSPKISLNIPEIKGDKNLATDIILLDAPDMEPLLSLFDLLNINSILTILKIELDIENGTNTARNTGKVGATYKPIKEILIIVKK